MSDDPVGPVPGDGSGDGLRDGSGDVGGRVDDGAEGLTPRSTPRYSRRLTDKIMIAFHHACDQDDLEIASALLTVMEAALTRRPSEPEVNRRRGMESLVAAHERLWHLRRSRH